MSIEEKVESACLRMLQLRPNIIGFKVRVTNSVREYFDENPLQINYNVTIIEDSTLVERLQDGDIIESDIWIEGVYDPNLRPNQ